MANPLPVTFATMQAAESYLLEKIGLFVNTLTGLPVFITNKPWPSNLEPSIGIRVLSYSDSGWGDHSTSTTSDTAVSEINLLPTIEFFAVRGDPMSALATVKMALRGMVDYKREMLYQYGIGVLTVSDVSPHDSVMDKIQTEFRAKMISNMSLRLAITELVSVPTITQITGGISSYNVKDATPDVSPIVLETEDTDPTYSGPPLDDGYQEFLREFRGNGQTNI